MLLCFLLSLCVTSAYEHGSSSSSSQEVNPLFPQRLSINQPASSSDHIVEIPAAGDDPTTQQSRGDGSPSSSSVISTALHVAVRQVEQLRPIRCIVSLPYYADNIIL